MFDEWGRLPNYTFAVMAEQLQNAAANFTAEGHRGLATWVLKGVADAALVGINNFQGGPDGSSELSLEIYSLSDNECSSNEPHNTLVPKPTVATLPPPEAGDPGIFATVMLSEWIGLNQYVGGFWSGDRAWTVLRTGPSGSDSTLKYDWSSGLGPDAAIFVHPNGEGFWTLARSYSDGGSFLPLLEFMPPNDSDNAAVGVVGSGSAKYPFVVIKSCCKAVDEPSRGNGDLPKEGDTVTVARVVDGQIFEVTTGQAVGPNAPTFTLVSISANDVVLMDGNKTTRWIDDPKNPKKLMVSP